MATELRTLILAHAGAQNLTRVTELSATNTGFTWSFSGFDVSDAIAASFTPMVIPCLAGTTTAQSFFRGFTQDVEGQFSPETTSTDDLVPLANAQTAAQLSVTARQAAFTGLVARRQPDEQLAEHD